MLSRRAFFQKAEISALKQIFSLISFYYFFTVISATIKFSGVIIGNYCLQHLIFDIYFIRGQEKTGTGCFREYDKEFIFRKNQTGAG